MEIWATILVVIVLAIFIVLLIPKAEGKRSKKQIVADMPYKRSLLLTKREYAFYKKLKTSAEEKNLGVLTKIRLADLVQVDLPNGSSDFLKYFRKISSKHIDFALVDKENMYVLALIELDDTTHSREDRVARDLFVNELLEKCNYILIRTMGGQEDIDTCIEQIEVLRNNKKA